MAFDAGITGISQGLNNEYLGSFQAAFDLDYADDLPFMENSIREGVDEFEKLWGFNPKYFVIPNGPFNNSLEKTLKEKGIEYILTERKQNEPLGNERFKRYYHYIGMKNKLGQIYLTRNAAFEPSLKVYGFHINPFERCMRDIELAFQLKKPASISTHRVNFIGFIEKGNREKNLRLFDELLSTIIKRWPEVEFMTSVELGDLIKNGK